MAIEYCCWKNMTVDPRFEHKIVVIWELFYCVFVPFLREAVLSEILVLYKSQEPLEVEAYRVIGRAYGLYVGEGSGWL